MLPLMKKLYLFAAMTMSASLFVSADEWRPIGRATIVDGWITPGYVDDEGKQIDPSTCPFEVDAEESVETPGVYKLINPFGSEDFHLSEFNLDGTPADIIIDARDRTFILIQAQYCGFTDADSSEPSGQYPYFLSDMGTYMWNLGQQREVINILKCSSVMNGNVITVRQPTFGTTADKAIQAWEPSYPAMIILPDQSEEDDSQWESLGIGQLVDGWLTPGWKNEDGSLVDPERYPIACEIQQNAENPDLLCLVDPFHSSDCFMSSANLYTKKTRIVFDVSDPDFVKVEMQFSGFIGRSDNDIVQFFVSEGGHILSQHGKTFEEIKEKGYNSTLKDGVITIPVPLFDFAISGTGKQWNATHPTIITLPGAGMGVSSVDADGNCEPEYFNLQGMRVSDPQHGRLYIRRTGSRSEKVIF